ncbi:MAG TPA: hypothetical protein VFZ61_05315, partial [Polyangiales bacterium]
CAHGEQPLEGGQEPIETPDADTPEREETEPDADAAVDDDTHGGPFERLLVADGVTPVAYVVDTATRETLASFGLSAVARVYSGALGRYGFAVQGEANRIQIFDSGLLLEDHGDHVHHERAAPGLLPFALTGARPVHFVGHGTQATAFFDDDGVAHVLDEHSLLDDAPQIVALDTGLPHHGVALAFGTGYLASVPQLLPPATRASPTGIAVYDATGTPTGQSFGACPSLHGEAALDHVAVFGCSDGVLVVESGAPHRGRKIANPASTVSPAPRVGTLVAHAALDHMVGNYGPERLCSIDLQANELRPIAVPAPYLQFGFDARGEYLLLLAKSGRLHLLDAHDLSEVAALDVTDAPGDDGDHGARAPQFAVGARHVYVTAPKRGVVVVVDLEHMTIAHEIRLPGQPTKIAVLGAAGSQHE